MNQTYNRNNTALLLCTSQGGPGNTYQWQANDTDIQGETMEMLTLNNVDASTGGLYTCVVTNAAGNDSASTYIFIAPYFTSQPKNEKVTNGSSVTLQCVAEAFPSPSYLWARTDGMPIRGTLLTTTDSFNFDPVMFGDEGDYFCNATSRNEVARSQDATLTGETSMKCVLSHYPVYLRSYADYLVGRVSQSVFLFYLFITYI